MFLEQDVEVSLPPEHQLYLYLPVMQVQSCGVTDKPDQSHSSSLQGDGIVQDGWKDAGTWKESFFWVPLYIFGQMGLSLQGLAGAPNVRVLLQGL